MIPILYEDESLLVCCKPVGVVSEADRGKGMPELLSAQLREAGKPDFIAGVHRLDKAVGGAMVFSRRKDVTGKLIAQAADRRARLEPVLSYRVELGDNDVHAVLAALREPA